jgi:hypothetical protein
MRSVILPSLLVLACLVPCGPCLHGQTAQTAASVAAVALPRTASQAGVPKVFAPVMPRTPGSYNLPQSSYSRYPWKTAITATLFWIGEEPGENNPTPNDKSSWDKNWQSNFGGTDTPDPAARNARYVPNSFVPKLNPFYIALPYNDVAEGGRTKSSAYAKIPWFKQRFKKPGHTVLKGQWLAIRYGTKVCYAQWEDCGPFETDDVEYVFGNARPINTKNSSAGIDISPAVRDYLGLRSGGRCDWRFVDVGEIPDGPWRWYGNNNHFINSQNNEKQLLQARLEELRRMRDEYFRKEGNSAYRRQ